MRYVITDDRNRMLRVVDVTEVQKLMVEGLLFYCRGCTGRKDRDVYHLKGPATLEMIDAILFGVPDEDYNT